MLFLYSIIVISYTSQVIFSQPNVIVFLVDDLGYGDLGYTGHPTTSSPNVDTLARSGKIFTQFYAGSSVCTPSRATLQTGRHSVRSGMYPNVQMANSLLGLPLEEVTLPEVLKKEGYATCMVGKWHLGVGEDEQYLPTKQGYDRYFGIPYSHDMCPFVTNCFPGEPCDSESPHPKTSPCPLYLNDQIVEQPTEFTSLTGKLSQQADEFIMESVKNEKPFFLFYSFHHVHFPQFSSDMFRNSSIRGAFGDSVAEMDWAVGQLISTLKETGQYNDTLIIFTSDNGPRSLNQGKGQGGSAGPFKCGKGTTYEGGQRVPAFVTWPNRVSLSIVNGLMSTLDIMPTVLGILGVESSLLEGVKIDGYDLSKTITQDEESPRREIVYIYPSAMETTGVHALRLNGYKAHFVTQGGLYAANEDIDCIMNAKIHSPPLLYNIEHDPSERYPLSDDNEKNYHEILENMLIMKKKIEMDLTWAPPRNAHYGDIAIPCCNRGCDPFPMCCSCTAV